jgi:hypothetical protein
MECDLCDLRQPWDDKFPVGAKQTNGVIYGTGLGRVAGGDNVSAEEVYGNKEQPGDD